MQETQAVFKPGETRPKYNVPQWPAKAELHGDQEFVFVCELLKQFMRFTIHASQVVGN